MLRASLWPSSTLLSGWPHCLSVQWRALGCFCVLAAVNTRATVLCVDMFFRVSGGLTAESWLQLSLGNQLPNFSQQWSVRVSNPYNFIFISFTFSLLLNSFCPVSHVMFPSSALPLWFHLVVLWLTLFLLLWRFFSFSHFPRSCLGSASAAVWFLLGTGPAQPKVLEPCQVKGSTHSENLRKGRTLV